MVVIYARSFLESDTEGSYPTTSRTPEGVLRALTPSLMDYVAALEVGERRGSLPTNAVFESGEAIGFVTGVAETLRMTKEQIVRAALAEPTAPAGGRPNEPPHQDDDRRQIASVLATAPAMLPLDSRMIGLLRSSLLFLGEILAETKRDIPD